MSQGQKQDIQVVLAVLRNYEGQSFTHAICKEIVKRLPIDDPLRTEVAIVLETTGVTMGEFGQAEAYERKRAEAAAWLGDPDPRVREFGESYTTHLDQMIASERARAEEEIALRRFRFGGKGS